MFGFGKGRKQREAEVMANAMLAPKYDYWFGRQPPANLAAQIVAQSFYSRKLNFAGRSFGEMGPFVHAAEALQAGYTNPTLNAEERAMCAHGLETLLRYALDPVHPTRVAEHERHYLALLGQSALDDKHLEAAKAHLTGIPKAIEKLKRPA
jgi:hypothetical protein